MQNFIGGIIIAFAGFATVWAAAYALGFVVEIPAGLIGLIA